MSEILYRENKIHYRKRVMFYKVSGLVIFVLYPIALIYTILFQIPISTINQKILLFIAFTAGAFGLLMVSLISFRNRELIIKDDMIYPPKVPFKYIAKKKDYILDYKDIIWFKVTTHPKKEVEGVLIKHPDFYIIDIHIPEFPIEAVMTTIKQLRKNINQKEYK